MHFLIAIIILSLFLGWIDSFRSHRRDSERKSNSVLPRRPATDANRSISVRPDSETKPDRPSAFTTTCEEISLFAESVSESISLHVRVEKATKRLRDEMSLERTLIETAIETAKRRLDTELRRNKMSPDERTKEDNNSYKSLEIKIISADTPALTYRSPEFSMPDGIYEDAMDAAIKDRIHSLKKVSRSS